MVKFASAVFLLIAMNIHGLPLLRISYPVAQEGYRASSFTSVVFLKSNSLIAPSAEVLSSPLFPENSGGGMRRTSLQVLFTMDSRLIYDRVQALREAYRPLINASDIPLCRFPAVPGIFLFKDTPPEEVGFFPLVSTIAITIPLKIR